MDRSTLSDKEIIMQHHFDISIAQKYGIEVAIFLNHMSFWITKNMANNKNFHEGTFWTHNSVDSYLDIFPYLSSRKIRSMIDDCVKHGLILKSNHSQKKYDRTNWYALTEKSCKLLNLTICQKRQMDLSKTANGFVRNVEPITVNNTVNNTDREQPRKKRVSARASAVASAPLSSFEPDKSNQELCQRLGLSITDELKSFAFRHKGEKNQYEFERWLKISSEYRLKNTPVVASNSVQFYGPGHPHWELMQQLKAHKTSNH
jgi:hypothetical protein